LLAIASCGGNKSHPDAKTGDAIPPGCGDGVKMGAEECDGTDLGGATCASAIAPGWVGAVTCTASCQFNVAGCNTPATTYNTFTAANWSTFDVSTLFPGATGFAGTAFDGKYMYFIPNNNGAVDGIVARYDTTAGFGSSGSWETFDVATVTATAKGFIGGAFDGRYVYFIPYNNGQPYDGVIARYDTHGTFGDSAAWETFDISTVNANARGFVTAAFDGRYLYLTPHYNAVVVGTNPGYHGITARYDTQAAFGMASSWETFDIATVNANAKGFLGSAFDGRYVYFTPYYNGAAYNGNVARFDTQDPGGFTTKAAWSTFNLQTVNANLVGFYSMTFDGRYLYLGQHYNGALAIPAYGGFMARYDTQASFTTAGSWSAFNAAAVNGSAVGFVGAAFDGQYVYMVPYANASASYHGITVRFDTTKTTAFNQTASWEAFNIASLNANAKGYHSAGFDGRYLYYAPSNDGAPFGIIARFDTKTPAWLPIGWNHAFD
jgi:hypothetical protein